MSALIDRYRQTLAVMQQLRYPPDHVVMETDDLAAFIADVEKAETDAFQARGLCNLAIALHSYAEADAARYRLAYLSARRRARRT